MRRAVAPLPSPARVAATRTMATRSTFPSTATIAMSPRRWLATSTITPGCRMARRCCWPAARAPMRCCGGSRCRARPRRLTNLNGFVDKLALGRTDSIEWQGPDGFHEDGVLTYPVGYQEGQKYPLVLVIHGGPEAGSTVQFAPLPQLLAAAGFIVFQPNYRGSTNLGDAYQHAIYRDTGEGPGKDVMAGLAAVEKLGMVDRSRIGVTGWSYGGYMTAWLTGHYPSTWKAAVAGAALTD